MKILLKRLSMVFIGSAFFVLLASSASAQTTWEVGSGTDCMDNVGVACDYASIQSAINNVSTINGDTIRNHSAQPYASLTIDKDITLNCYTGTNADSIDNISSVVITSDSVIDNCEFNRTGGTCSTSDPYLVDVQGSISVYFANNTFKFFGKVIDYSDDSDNYWSFDNNTFDGMCADSELINLSGTGIFNNNTFENIETPAGSSQTLVSILINTATPAGDLDVTNNTISSIEDINITTGIKISNPNNNVDVEVRGNTFNGGPYDTLQYGLILEDCGSPTKPCAVYNNIFSEVYAGIALTETIENVSITQNTFWGSDPGSGVTIAGITIYGATTDVDDLDVKFNIFQGYQTGIYTDNDVNPLNSITNQTFDYNMYWDLDLASNGGDAVDGVIETPGINSVGYYNPALSDPANDVFNLLASSMAIGFCSTDSCPGGDNGAVDYSGARTTTLTVDAGGGAHFTSIIDAVNASTTNDAITVAAGNYSTSDVVTSGGSSAIIADGGEDYLDGYEAGIDFTRDGLTITGTGGSGAVTIDASGSEYGIWTSGLNAEITGFTISGGTNTSVERSEGDSGTFSDLVLEGEGTTYKISNHPYSYDGDDFDSSGGGGISIMTAGPTFTDIIAAGETTTDITDFISGTPQDWDLALASNGVDTYVTILADSNDFPLESDIEAVTPPGFTIVCYFPDVYTYSGGTYSYDPPTGCAAGAPTLVGSPYATTAHIDDSTSIANGFEISGDSNILSNITFEGYNKALLFSGAANSNAIPSNSSVSFTGNATDISQNSSGTNSVDGCEADYAFEELLGTLSFSGTCGGAASIPEFNKYIYLILVVVGIGLILTFYRNFGRKMGTA